MRFGIDIVLTLGVSLGLMVLTEGRSHSLSDRPDAEVSRRYLYNGEQLEQPVSPFEVEWLKSRKVAQEGRWLDSKIFHDFKFVDRQPSSGITFKHGIVDD